MKMTGILIYEKYFWLCDFENVALADDVTFSIVAGPEWYSFHVVHKHYIQMAHVYEFVVFVVESPDGANGHHQKRKKERTEKNQILY
jgi:hypothetical protein